LLKFRSLLLGHLRLPRLLPVLALLLMAGGAMFARPGNPTEPMRTRHFTFEYSTTVHPAPQGAQELNLWLPMPHSDAWQDIDQLEITSPYPYEILPAQHGNRVLHLKLLSPPAADFTVTMRFNAVRREHRNPLQASLPAQARNPVPPADADLARWLAPDHLVPLDGQIRQWAQEVVTKAHATTPLAKAQAIYNHVVSTVKYDKTGQGWGQGDIYYACDARRGNCTDFHAVFIGYCRAVGIPARFSIGFPLPAQRGSGEIKGYHCWAEFYTPETGWVPIDASEAAKDPARRSYFFGAHDENRVEFTRGRDLTLAPSQRGEPLNYFIYPYAEVDGRPFAALEKQFRYEDVSPVASPTR
jgi:transglutaminase-like putative cysteine protease